ncbi:hypothetical protein HK098_000252 [Nowakowskiella sp. JEL0407]|nr:hypothetical protein HK098_000252 [Nowakowskiella sp. JEL0407]
MIYIFCGIGGVNLRAQRKRSTPFSETFAATKSYFSKSKDSSPPSFKQPDPEMSFRSAASDYTAYSSTPSNKPRNVPLPEPVTLSQARQYGSSPQMQQTVYTTNHIQRSYTNASSNNSVAESFAPSFGTKNSYYPKEVFHTTTGNPNAPPPRTASYARSEVSDYSNSYGRSRSHY